MFCPSAHARAKRTLQESLRWLCPGTCQSPKPLLLSKPEPSSIILRLTKVRQNKSKFKVIQIIFYALFRKNLFQMTQQCYREILTKLRGKVRKKTISVVKQFHSIRTSGLLTQHYLRKQFLYGIDWWKTKLHRCPSANEDYSDETCIRSEIHTNLEYKQFILHFVFNCKITANYENNEWSWFPYITKCWPLF